MHEEEQEEEVEDRSVVNWWTMGCLHCVERGEGRSRAKVRLGKSNRRNWL